MPPGVRRAQRAGLGGVLGMRPYPATRRPPGASLLAERARRRSAEPDVSGGVRSLFEFDGDHGRFFVAECVEVHGVPVAVGLMGGGRRRKTLQADAERLAAFVDGLLNELGDLDREAIRR